MRGGDVAGEHTVTFLASRNVLSLRIRQQPYHFCAWALTPLSLRQRPKGLYSMDDVLAEYRGIQQR